MVVARESRPTRAHKSSNCRNFGTRQRRSDRHGNTRTRFRRGDALTRRSFQHNLKPGQHAVGSCQLGESVRRHQRGFRASELGSRNLSRRSLCVTDCQCLLGTTYSCSHSSRSSSQAQCRSVRILASEFRACNASRLLIDESQQVGPAPANRKTTDATWLYVNLGCPNATDLQSRQNLHWRRQEGIECCRSPGAAAGS